MISVAGKVYATPRASTAYKDSSEASGPRIVHMVEVDSSLHSGQHASGMDTVTLSLELERDRERVLDGDLLSSGGANRS